MSTCWFVPCRVSMIASATLAGTTSRSRSTRVAVGAGDRRGMPSGSSPSDPCTTDVRCWSSSGHAEDRIVVLMRLTLARRRITAEVTLTDRDEMGFRMLVGRQALSRLSSWTRDSRMPVGVRRARPAARTGAGHEPPAPPRLLRDRHRQGASRPRPRGRSADHPAGHRRRRQPCPSTSSTAVTTGRRSGSMPPSTATRSSASRSSAGCSPRSRRRRSAARCWRSRSSTSWAS